MPKAYPIIIGKLICFNLNHLEFLLDHKVLLADLLTLVQIGSIHLAIRTKAMEPNLQLFASFAK